jgi:serine/threonine protein kinase
MGDHEEQNFQVKPFPFHAGCEPIQGFFLTKSLGNGGFGIVWSAKGPGGIPVAMKFIWLGSPKSSVEWNGLKHCRTIRHPHLLSILGIWVVDGWMVVVSELADTDLYSLWQKAQVDGLIGLDPVSLQLWFRDAAEGLDYLQSLDLVMTHGDVKPANLLLLGGRCKVGDFGSFRPTLGSDLFQPPGVTRYFIAPEAENGATHPNSDQYSLALSYSILRGVAPLDLEIKNDPVKLGKYFSEARLSKPEARALCKALRQNPNERHGSCLAMVQSFLG